MKGRVSIYLERMFLGFFCATDKLFFKIVVQAIIRCIGLYTERLQSNLFLSNFYFYSFCSHENVCELHQLYD